MTAIGSAIGEAARAPEGGRRPAAARPAWRVSAGMVVLGLLTALALVLRATRMGEGIFGDELFTLRETRGHDVLGVLDAVAHGAPGQGRLEDNPPLFFVLAWLGAQVADPTAWIRLPSVVAGAATVPALYALGLRTFGRTAGLAGGALMALSPFAVFYGTEARAYALLMFLATLATLALLTAIERREAGWWVTYGLCAAALLYTHYTGAVVLAVHGAWTLGFHRDRWRALLLVFGAVALLYVPWLPYVDGSPANFGFLAAFLHVHYSDALLQWLIGVPEFQPQDMPGVPALVLLGTGVVVGLIGWTPARRRGRRPLVEAAGAGPERARLLVLALAAATPMACLLYGLRGPDLFLFPRNLSASLPFAALALGAAVSPPRRALTAVALALAGLGLTIAATRSLEQRFHRPDFRAVAAALDADAGPRDLVVYYGRGLAALVLLDGVRLYTHAPHPFGGADLVPGSLMAALDGKGRDAQRSFVVGPTDEAQLPPAVAGWEETAQRAFDGHPALRAITYERLPADRYALTAAAIHGPSGRVWPISARPGAGVLDSATVAPGGVALVGWAATTDHRPVQRVLAFARGRLVAAGIPTARRPDLARAWKVSPRNLGFRLAVGSEAVRPRGARLAVFAVAGDRAAPLRISCSPVPVVGC